MSTVDVYLGLVAAERQQAVRRTSVRHVHLSDDPFVVVGYHLAGDRGAPVAMMWGRGHSAPQTMVVPEPRSRDLRFERLRPFAEALAAYVADDADDPQLVVPNGATARWLTDIVGRFTWALPVQGDRAVAAEIPRAGKHLMFLGQERRTPGSSMVLAAVESLSLHYRTGQAPDQDLNLGSVLGWIRPPHGSTGRAAAVEGEEGPPAGPVSDPGWDRDQLEPRVHDWNEADNDARRRFVSNTLKAEASLELSHAWDQTWTALDVLSDIPSAASVAERRGEDMWRLQRHRDRMQQESEVRFRSRPRARNAAVELERAERAQKLLETQMLLDDPMLLAVHVADGSAVAGTVGTVDRSRASRPTLTLRTELPTFAVPGTELHLSEDTRVTAVVEHVQEDSVQLRIVRGANQSRSFARLPTAGQRAIFSTVALPQFRPPPEPLAQTPWTHAWEDDGLAPGAGDDR